MAFATFLGQSSLTGRDWRSPGDKWVKTESGWKRVIDVSPTVTDDDPGSSQDHSQSTEPEVWGSREKSEGRDSLNRVDFSGSRLV